MDGQEEEEGTTLLRLGSFTLISRAGEGDGGVVWKALRKQDAMLCAIKILKAPYEKNIPKEIAILEALNNPGHTNIMKYHGWGKINKIEQYLKKQSHLCCFTGGLGAFIAMEWIEGVTLEAKITESTFGKNKRRFIFKQLVEALVYMHSKRISHGSLFLDNLLISIPNRVASSQPHLTLCDFGASTIVPQEHPGLLSESQLDKDRCQCGAVLFALFSSTNLASQLVKNAILQKDAFQIAKNLIDVRRTLTLESTLLEPFLTNDMCEDRFPSYSTTWNDEITENIATHLIQTGDVLTFANASLVCKQFYVALQRKFICTPFPQMLTPYDFDAVMIDFASPIEDYSIWLERVMRAPYKQVFTALQYYYDEDKEFEAEIVKSNVASLIEQITLVHNFIMNMSFADQHWDTVLIHFHAMRGLSTYIGFEIMKNISWHARDRARIHLYNRITSEKVLHAEKLLYYRIIESMRGLLRQFNLDARKYLQESGHDIPIHAI